MVETDTTPLWTDAEWAAALIALLGHSVGGVHLRSPPGPVRDYWLERVRHLSGQSHLRKVPASIPEGRLLGGIDLAATLKHGRPVAETGLLEECDRQMVIAAMAERLPRNSVHHLCTALDSGRIAIARDGVERACSVRVTLIAQDEGTEEEFAHSALTDRLGLALDMTVMGIHDVEDEIFTHTDIKRALARIERVVITQAQQSALTALSLSLGIGSPRPTLAALKVARGSAALRGDDAVTEEDIARALRLCLLPKAERLPDISETPPEPESEPEPREDSEPPPTSEQPPSEEDRLLEAMMTQLPEGLLEQLQSRAARLRQSTAGSAGAQHRHQQRGRPTGALRGDHRRGGRVNILATLRAAAPWQPIRRRQEAPDSSEETPRDGQPLRKIEIRSDDIHITRFQQRRESLTLFVVDASGSAAMQRLAEAKGAVELLLADCYVRRDQVALIAFRNETAELLLPPTRSLVRAKRALAALPGGGATPMAAALDLTRDLAERASKQGTTMQYVILTDGAANVSRDGTRNREAGTRDALTAARALAAGPSSGLVIDTAQRPQPRARELAESLRGTYIALPKADSQTLNRAIRAARS
ncbi:MAG: magnesium chelatase subunit D [Luminiphilus sp.]|nr:magnesium chelatase subunit D [Luminiphilus sp.]